MTAVQLELVERSEIREEADAEVLAAYLYVAGDWRTRKEIMAALSWPDWRIRHAAEAAKGDVIFGQRGMRHYLQASAEEFSAYVATMKSQVEAMQKRIISSEKKYHSRGGAA